MIGADDPRKPLLSKLLAVPALKARYLHYLRQIATQDLNWNQIRPLVERHRALLEREIAADTRKLDTLEAFEQALGLSASAAGGPQQDPRVRGPMSIREFVEKRSAYLLSLPAVRDAR
jgi:hypothetical protein